jgi:hypothetical protein
VNELLHHVVSTKLQFFSAILQSQGRAKGVAPLGCPGWGEAVALTQNDIYDGRVHISKSIHGQVKSRAGVHVTTAQKLMGHADPGVTLGIYTRFRDEEIDNAGAAIMDSLRGKSDYLMF